MEGAIIPTLSAWTLIALGVILMSLELFMTVFIMLFFGLAFVVVGLASFVWNMSGDMQILAGLILGALFLFLLRKAFLKSMNQAEEVKLETFEEGDMGKIVEFNNEFRVDYKGTTWTIKNKHEVILESGQMVKVVSIENNQASVETL